MTRSEEHLVVGPRREAGRFRLRKHIVTEQQTATVPVSHEEVRVEREPITDANRNESLEAPEVSEDEREIVLHRDVPVVTTETEAVERVRLATDTITDTEDATGEVRSERVEVEGDAPAQPEGDRSST